MKGIIYCKDYNSIKNQGNSKLKEIIEKYKEMGITSTYVIASNKSYADFSNGDNWRVLKASDQNRAARCNIAYIERNIDYDVYRTAINCSIQDFPYSAIHLWGEGDLHIDNSPELPFR